MLLLVSSVRVLALYLVSSTPAELRPAARSYPRRPLRRHRRPRHRRPRPCRLDGALLGGRDERQHLSQLRLCWSGRSRASTRRARLRFVFFFLAERRPADAFDDDGRRQGHDHRPRSLRRPLVRSLHRRSGGPLPRSVPRRLTSNGVAEPLVRGAVGGVISGMVFFSWSIDRRQRRDLYATID